MKKKRKTEKKKGKSCVSSSRANKIFPKRGLPTLAFGSRMNRSERMEWSRSRGKERQWRGGRGSSQSKFERTADFRDGRTGFINMQRNARPAEPVEYLWNFIVLSFLLLLLLLLLLLPPRADYVCMYVRLPFDILRVCRSRDSWWKELDRGNEDKTCCETIVNGGMGVKRVRGRLRVTVESFGVGCNV